MSGGQYLIDRHPQQTPVHHLSKTMADEAIPEWVNQQLFHSLLEQSNNNFKAIVKFAPEAAITKGENYMTIVLRIHIEMQLKGESVGRVSLLLLSNH